MAGSEAGEAEGGEAEARPGRWSMFADDTLVLTAVGLTIAALLSILALVAVRAAPGPKFGDRVLLFASTDPVGQFGFGLLALAALALVCVEPVDAARHRLISSLRAVVGLVAAALVVVSGYAVVAFATDAAIGHTQFMANWGPAARTASAGLAGSSLLLAACALWLVSRRADDVPDDAAVSLPSTRVPSWGVVSGVALLTMLGALALVELVAEPLFRSTSPTGPMPFIDRLDSASRAFGSYPIAVLTFGVVGMVVLARQRAGSSGARLLAVASTVAVVGVAVAVFVVVRVLAHRGAAGTGTDWDRTQAASLALTSGIVAALAWIAALRFGTAEERAATMERSSPYRAPSVSTIRVAAALVGAATVGLAMEIVSGYAQAHDPAPIGLKTEGVSLEVMLVAGVALGAGLLAELARSARSRWVGRAFLAVVAGAAMFLGVYAFGDALFVDRVLFGLTSPQRHQFAALGAAAALLAFALLTLIVDGLREAPETGDVLTAELEAA